MGDGGHCFLSTASWLHVPEARSIPIAIPISISMARQRCALRHAQVGVPKHRNSETPAYGGNEKGAREGRLFKRKILYSRSLGLLGGDFLFPSAGGCLGDEAFFEGLGGDANVAHFAVDDGFDALEVGEEAALRDRGDVGTDTTFALGLTTSPDFAALNWALTR
jgi:hypothetical protein